MTYLPETLIGKTADLLRSLHGSILGLRTEAETLREDLRAQDPSRPEFTQIQPKIAKLETLIRDCQKVEKSLVEQSVLIRDTPTQGASYDFDAIRAEIDSRLARLRATGAGGAVSG